MVINEEHFEPVIQALPGFKKSLETLNEFHRKLELIKKFPLRNPLKEVKYNPPYQIEEFKYK